MTVKLENIRVEYTAAATVPTGGFSNVKPEYKISADVVEGSPEEAFGKIKALADRLLMEEVAEIEAEKRA